jgi:hypothetical protein
VYNYIFVMELASQFPAWVNQINTTLDTGIVPKNPNPLSLSHCGSIKYTKTIERAHPGYLHNLFRYAQRVKGAKDSF